MNHLPTMDEGICKGGDCIGRNEAKPLHTCPFKSEICDDNETLCDCCDECASGCAQDV